MAAPALERQPQQEEPQETKPELRLVGPEKEMTVEEAEQDLADSAMGFERQAANDVAEMTKDAKALADLGEKQGSPLTPDEASQNADITARAEAAADRLKTDVAATQAEAKVRDLEAQYKNASGDQKRALETQLEAATKAWQEARTAAKKAEAPKEATVSPVPEMDAEAPRKTEAKVDIDLDALLPNMPPEVRRQVAEQYAKADESAYGGLVSKGVDAQGIVRLGYKDGTIMEVFPGGQKRSNRPEATGAERIPSLPDYLNDAQPAAVEAGLLTLEEDVDRDKEALLALESGAGVPGSDARKAELRDRIKNAEAAIARKSTPDGLAKEVADMQALIATEEADMNAAPEEEKAGYVDRIEQWKKQKQGLEDRLAKAKGVEAAPTDAKDEAEEAPAAAPEAKAEVSPAVAAEAARRAEAVKTLEGELRDLEAQYEAASDPGQKAALERQLQDKTRAWEDARGLEASPIDAAAAEAEARRRRIQELEEKMRDLEKQRAALQGSDDTWAPDKKAALERELEATTKEWEKERAALNAAEAAVGAVVADAVAEAGPPVAEIAAAAVAAETAKEAPAAETAAKPAEKPAEAKAGGPKKTERWKPDGSFSGGGGGGGGGGEKKGFDWGKVGKALENFWDFMGGWTGKK